jgi:hypothetical protein
MPSERQIKSLEETRPATTGTFDSFMFSNMTGFSPSALIMPASSYSVETGFVILVNSFVFWSSSMKFLKPTLVRLRFNLLVCLLKKQSQFFVLFSLCGCGGLGFTIHWGVWEMLCFWFGVFFGCISCGGGMVSPHWVRGIYGVVWECGCGNMLDA